MGNYPFGIVVPASVLLDPSGDTSGVTDTANVTTAIANLAGGGTVQFAPGTFYITCGSVVVNAGVPVFFQGAGAGATILSAVGTGDVLRAFSTSSSFPGLNGGISQLTIDGTNAGAGSSGVHVGDLSFYRFDDARVANFTGAASIGFWFDNQNRWTEKLHGRITVTNCTSGVVFDVSGNNSATNSFAYQNLQIWIDMQVNQDGVVLRNGAFIYHAILSIHGNMTGSSGAVTNAVLRITGAVPAGHASAGNGSRIQSSQLNVMVETQTAANQPQTIVFGTFGGAGGNVITTCYGVLDFARGSGTFATSNWIATSNSGTFIYAGTVLGDTALNPSFSGSLYSPGPLIYGRSLITTGATASLSVSSGDFFNLVLAQNVTIALPTPPGGPQRKIIILTQAAAGGPFTVTWPHTVTPSTAAPTVNWAGGVAPVMSVGASAVDVYELVTFNGATWFGNALQAVS